VGTPPWAAMAAPPWLAAALALALAARLLAAGARAAVFQAGALARERAVQPEEASQRLVAAMRRQPRVRAI